MKQQYIGISVSFCISAICKGEMPEDQVAGIVPSFTLDETNDKAAVFERYSKSYWMKFPEQAWEVFQRMKIIQFDGHTSHNISAGIWIREENFNKDALFNDELKIQNPLPVKRRIRGNRPTSTGLPREDEQ